MSYLGFARKYRPQNFDEVVGQQHIATTLKNAIQVDRVHHAYLFCGSRGVGKTSMARIFSKALNCETGPTITPCNQCASCKRISTGEDIDVLEIDGASNRGIEEIRNIKDDIKYLPTQARYKIFIIDEVHMLTQAAFNALLKTLEEPPAHVKFVFATTHVSAIPDTILSRCQRFDFKKISFADIVGRLQQIAEKESIQISPEALEKMSRSTGGALRDSLVLLDQLSAYAGKVIDADAITQIIGSGKDIAQEILEALGNRDITNILDVLQKFFQNGGEPTIIVESLAQQLRDVLIVSVQDDNKFIEGSEAYLEWLQKCKAMFSPESIMRILHHIMETKKYVQKDLMGRIVVETLMVKICRMESIQPLDNMIKRLEKLEGFAKGNNIALPPINSTPMGFSNPIPQISTPPIPPPIKSEASLAEKIKQNQEVFNASQKNKPKAASKTPPPPKGETPWERFIEDLGRSFSQSAKFLDNEAKVQITKNKVVIGLKPEFKSVKDLLTIPKNKTTLLDLLKKHFGPGVSLHWDIPKDPSQDVNHQKIKEMAEKDPVVFKCLELFGGRILGVTKNK